MNSPVSLTKMVSAKGQVLGRPKGRLGLLRSRHAAIVAWVLMERHVLDAQEAYEVLTARHVKRRQVGRLPALDVKRVGPLGAVRADQQQAMTSRRELSIHHVRP